MIGTTSAITGVRIAHPVAMMGGVLAAILGGGMVIHGHHLYTRS